MWLHIQFQSLLPQTKPMHSLAVPVTHALTLPRSPRPAARLSSKLTGLDGTEVQGGGGTPFLVDGVSVLHLSLMADTEKNFISAKERKRGQSKQSKS